MSHPHHDHSHEHTSKWDVLTSKIPTPPSLTLTRSQTFPFVSVSKENTTLTAHGSDDIELARRRTDTARRVREIEEEIAAATRYDAAVLRLPITRQYAQRPFYTSSIPEELDITNPDTKITGHSHSSGLTIPSLGLYRIRKGLVDMKVSILEESITPERGHITTVDITPTQRSDFEYDKEVLTERKKYKKIDKGKNISSRAHLCLDLSETPTQGDIRTETFFLCLSSPLKLHDGRTISEMIVDLPSLENCKSGCQMSKRLPGGILTRESVIFTAYVPSNSHSNSQSSYENKSLEGEILFDKLQFSAQMISPLRNILAQTRTVDHKSPKFELTIEDPRSTKQGIRWDTHTCQGRINLEEKVLGIRGESTTSTSDVQGEEEDDDGKKEGPEETMVERYLVIRPTSKVDVIASGGEFSMTGAFGVVDYTEVYAGEEARHGELEGEGKKVMEDVKYI